MPKNKYVQTLAVAAIVLILILIFGNFQEKKEINVTKDITKIEKQKDSISKQKNIIIEEQSVKSDSIVKQKVNIPNYKDIFKDDDIDNISKQNKEDEKLIKLIKKDSETLIADADKLIRDNNLKLPRQPLSKERIERLNKLDNEIYNINEKIMEFRR